MLDQDIVDALEQAATVVTGIATLCQQMSDELEKVEELLRAFHRRFSQPPE